jgi:hypothetical protein
MPNNGGSPIISYEVQMDDGKNGIFTSIIGFNSNSLLTVYIVDKSIIKGRRHRFRYRAKNIVGWGSFSDDSFILAATVPSRPDRPYFLAFANETLSIVIPRSVDNGGTPISNYELWVDEGNDFNSDFRQLLGYIDNSLIYSVTINMDNLQIGRVYRFKSRSINQIGPSDFSIFSYIAFGDVPSAPGPAIRV